MGNWGGEDAVWQSGGSSSDSSGTGGPTFMYGK